MNATPARSTRPAWRDSGNYPDPQKASNRTWTWEFLRRNPKYQETWRQYRAACEGDNDPENMRAYDPPRREGEAEDVWIERVTRDGSRARSTPLGRSLAKPWGLRFLADPNRKKSQRVWFEVSPVIHMGPGFPLRELMRTEGGRAESPTHSALWIDLRLPLEKLVAHVIAAVKTDRASRIKDGSLVPDQQRFDRNKLRNYLQALDAEQAGASVADIACALLPHGDRDGRSTIRRWLKEAKRIRDRDWLALASSNDPVGDRWHTDGADQFLRSVKPHR